MAEQLLNTIINRKYRLLSVLGGGAMGIVYRATQLDDEGLPLREVALKMIGQQYFLHDPEAAQRFRREVRVAMRLSSPNVVTVYDSGQTDQGALYFTMELIRGETLRELLTRERQLSVPRAIAIASQICEALEEAHGLAEPIIHRDLKPPNIFIVQHADRELVKVGDFGIAKVLGEQTSGLTHTGMSPGTPRYMSPEQCQGHELDGRADLYALGILLYEMVTGAPPFTAVGDPVALMYKHLHEMPPPLPATVPAEIRRIVEHLLAKAPGDRPPAALSVRRALGTDRFSPPEQHTAVVLREEQASVPKPQRRAVRPEEPERGKAPSLPAAAPTTGQKTRGLSLAGIVSVGLLLILGGWWYVLPRSAVQVASEPGHATGQHEDTIRQVPQGRRAGRVEEGAQRQVKEQAPQPLASQPAEQKQQKQLGEMVQVPAGVFWMGCDEKRDQECRDNEKPGGQVHVQAFAIDRYEVTVAAYRRCVNAGQCSVDGLTSEGSCNWAQRGRRTHPINCVNWYQAQAYCHWTGKRLPTQAEWEKAARGTDGRKYPWGNTWAQKGNFGRNGTVAVGSYAAGVSPYGAYDMAGNVWEWGQTGWKGTDQRAFKIIRGGSWGNRQTFARTSFLTGFVPSYRSGRVGIRCAQ